MEYRQLLYPSTGRSQWFQQLDNRVYSDLLQQLLNNKFKGQISVYTKYVFVSMSQKTFKWKNLVTYSHYTLEATSHWGKDHWCWNACHQNQNTASHENLACLLDMNPCYKTGISSCGPHSNFLHFLAWSNESVLEHINTFTAIYFYEYFILYQGQEKHLSSIKVFFLTD